MIKEIDKENKRIAISVKMCQENPYDTFAKTYKIDDVVKAHEKLYKNNHIGKIILKMNNKIS